MLIHNATLQPSTGIHHTMCVYELMIYDSRAADVNEDLDFKGKNEEYRTDGVNAFLTEPYIVLLELDGGLDHNLTFVSNRVSLFVLFLVGNMDKLIIFVIAQA